MTEHSADRVNNDYYGVFEEINEVKYFGLPIKRTFEFRCSWYDPNPRVDI